MKDLLVRRIKMNDRKGAEDALRWCQINEISSQELYIRLDLQSVEPFFEVYDTLVHKSRKMIREIPVFMGGEGALDLLFRLVKKLRPGNVLETGVAYGWSSMAILLAMEENNTGKLTSTDMPYPKMDNEEFIGVLVNEHLKKRWQLLQLPDKSGIPIAIKEHVQFDLIHYDSDKSYEGRKWAYPILWNSLSSGGVFISDDIQDNIAFKEFCSGIQRNPCIIKVENKFVGLLSKNEVEE